MLSGLGGASHGRVSCLLARALLLHQGAKVLVCAAPDGEPLLADLLSGLGVGHPPHHIGQEALLPTMQPEKFKVVAGETASLPVVKSERLHYRGPSCQAGALPLHSSITPVVKQAIQVHASTTLLFFSYHASLLQVRAIGRSMCDADLPSSMERMRSPAWM